LVSLIKKNESRKSLCNNLSIIKKNNIDYVGISMEYKDTEKDIFFHKGAIDMNINIYVDRCDIISSTDIIKKCKNIL
jgi:hypothetical protein